MDIEKVCKQCGKKWIYIELSKGAAKRKKYCDECLKLRKKEHSVEYGKAYRNRHSKKSEKKSQRLKNCISKSREIGISYGEYMALRCREEKRKAI